MSQKKISARFQLRRDTASNWEAKNEVLLDGEKIIVVTAAGQTRFKVGDGVKTFSQLPYTDETLNEAISKKVDAVSGKQLSTNDYTTSERAKLAGIAPGAEVNVQSDWNISSVTSDAYIKNKPTKLSDFENDTGFMTVDELPSYTAEDIGALPNPPGGTDGQVPVKTADGVAWQDLPSPEMIETFATLTAAGWSGTTSPFSQTVTVKGVTATSVQQILPPLNITAEQLKALQAANIQDGGQATDQITLLAFGSKPTIDLPLRIYLY